MKTNAMIAVMLVAVLGGCATLSNVTIVQDEIERERIFQNIDRVELAVNMGLAFAELRGVDSAKILQIQKATKSSFALLRSALEFQLTDTSPEGLVLAMDGFRNIMGDVFFVCRSVGVSPSILNDIEIQVDKVLASLERVIQLYSSRA